MRNDTPSKNGMDRLVPLFDPRRKEPMLLRLGNVPSLFSEGSQCEHMPNAAGDAFAAVKTRFSRLFQSPSG